MLRRTFLKTGVFGASTLYFSDSFAADTKNEQSVVSIHLQGGISAVDFINPIPEEPIEFRSSRGAIDAGGFQIGGDFIELAKLGDKLSIVRSMKFKDANHQTATLAHMTSHFHVPNNGQKEPSFGSLVAKQYAPNSKVSGIPHYVKLRNIAGDDSSWLGIKYAGYDADAEGVKNMKPNVDAKRFDQRIKMMKSIDSRTPLQDMGRGWSDLKDMSVNIIKGTASEAFDLDKEPESVYDKSRFGQDLLLARRLVERGTKYVSLNSNAGWDNHSGIDNAFRANAPALDKGLATLIKDLDDRGLLQNTLVVVWSEFSRTKMNLNAGRDHNPGTNTLLFAGGNSSGGIIGETDKHGLVSQGTIYSPKDLAWTIGSHMGLSKDMVIKDMQARPRYIFGDDAKNILV